MSVKIKDLDATIELKNNGMELEIRDSDENFIGDLVITKAAVIWCEGKTGRKNGIRVPMKKFLDLMRGQEEPVAPKKRAK